MKKIILLCGDINGDHIPSFNETGDYSSSGSVARVHAAKYMLDECFYETIICSGGHSDRRIESSLAYRYMICLRNNGVDQKDIYCEWKSSNTYEQLINCIDLFNNNDAVTIITNTYHVGRVNAFILYRSELAKYKKGNITIASAENILRHKETTFNYEIKMAYKLSPMKKRIEKEKAGIEQIKNGTYDLKSYRLQESING